MRRPLVYSIILHMIVIAMVAFGLPALAPSPLLVEEPMVVDLVPLAERVNPPPATQPAPVPEAAKPAAPKPARDERPEPVPKPAEPKAAARPEPAPALPKPAAPKTEPKPEPPKPEPKAETKAEKPFEPKPPSKPEPPKPEPAKAEPKPATSKPELQKPEPKTVARTEPEPEPKPQAKPKPPSETKSEQKLERTETKAEPKVQEKPVPSEHKTETSRTSPPPATVQRKAEPADDFASVMKTVENIKQSGKSEAKPSPPARKAESADPEFGAQVAQALRSAGPIGNKPSLPVTASEIDAVRRQIERCWNLPAGVKDAGDLVVSLRVEMNADGTPRSAVVDGSSRGQNNPLFQATADSARRAVLNPRCHPFKLPPDKYDRWRTMTLIFNPREMAGT